MTIINSLICQYRVMAKKLKFSHIRTQEAQTGSTLYAENIPYVLLSVFCGYGDASLDCLRDGRDNRSHDSWAILVKDKFVYRLFNSGVKPLDTNELFYVKSRTLSSSTKNLLSLLRY